MLLFGLPALCYAVFGRLTWGPGKSSDELENTDFDSEADGEYGEGEEDCDANPSR